MIKQSDGYLAYTNSVKEYLLSKKIPSEKITVLNNTIDIDKTVNFLNQQTNTVIKRSRNGNSNITINKKTGRRIAALIVVHTFGNAVNLDKLVSLCRKKKLFSSSVYKKTIFIINL